MKLGSICIYYNSKWGYIVASDTIMKDSIMKVTINPVEVEKADISTVQLGRAVLWGLDKSRKAMPVDSKLYGDYKFWQITGIKGFAAFSKRFKCIEVVEKDGRLKAVRMKRDSDGAYSWNKNDAGIELALDSSEERIGHLINYLFLQDEAKNENVNDLVCFQSLNENKVTFKRPSDEFTDIGDGHTDAYQIFLNESDKKSYIAFLIDNGYSQINSQEIQRCWKQTYGKLEDYTYEENNIGPFKVIVGARTERTVLKSYFFQDGEDLLEVLTEVNNALSTEQQINIKKEMERIVNSITIV